MSRQRISHHKQSAPASPNAESSGQGPLFNVVSGNPSAEELAALTAVVLGLSTPGPAPESKQRTRSWIRRRQLRLQPAPGPGAWRRSGH
jgi:hypothetical protein